MSSTLIKHRYPQELETEDAFPPTLIEYLLAAMIIIVAIPFLAIFTGIVLFMISLFLSATVAYKSVMTLFQRRPQRQ